MGQEFKSVEVIDLKAQVSKIVQSQLCELMQTIVTQGFVDDITADQIAFLAACRDTLALDWRGSDN